MLKSSLAIVIRVYSASGTVLAIIGQEKNKRFDKARKKRSHAGGISGRGELTPIHLVEEDVQPHEITGERQTAIITHKKVGRRTYRKKVGFGRVLKMLAIPTTGGIIYRARVRHPGHKGAHFVRAAAVEAEKPGLTAFEQKLVDELMKGA